VVPLVVAFKNTFLKERCWEKDGLSSKQLSYSISDGYCSSESQRCLSFCCFGVWGDHGIWEIGKHERTREFRRA